MTVIRMGTLLFSPNSQLTWKSLRYIDLFILKKSTEVYMESNLRLIQDAVKHPLYYSASTTY